MKNQIIIFISAASFILFSFTFQKNRTENTAAEGNSENSDTVKIINEKGFDNFVFKMRNKELTPESLGKCENNILQFTTGEAGYFRTKEVYSNYILHTEWRFPVGVEKGNSGILVCQQKPDSVWPECIQIQLKQGKTGDLIAMNGAKFAEAVGKPKDTADKYSDEPERKSGEWSTAEITCKDDSIVVYINGILQNKATRTNFSSGFIGFQLEGKPVEFRNIYLFPVKKDGVYKM